MSVGRFKRSSHQMTPCSEGDWVRYEYYAQLEAENAALKAKLAKADGLAEACERLIKENFEELDDLRCPRFQVKNAIAAYKEDEQ